jgi:hypothetical protein
MDQNMPKNSARNTAYKSTITNVESVEILSLRLKNFTVQLEIMHKKKTLNNVIINL